MKTAGHRRKPTIFPLWGVIWPRQAVLAAIGGVLAFAPLAYGAVHTWAYTIISLALAGLSLILLVWATLTAVSPGTKAVTLPRPPSWGLVLAAGLLAVLQIVPLPQEVVSWLSPKAIQIRSLGNGYGLAAMIPLSLNPNATVQDLLQVWSVVVLFILLVYTVNSRGQIQGLAYLLLAVALFEAAYGLWHFRSHLIWGWKNPFYIGRLCGTFINPNHVAGYLTMAIFLGCGLFLAQEGGQGSRPHSPQDQNSLRYWSRADRLEPLIRRSFFLMILLVLVVAFFFAASRGAFLSLVVGLAFMGLAGTRQFRGRWPFTLVLLFLAGAILYCLWLGGAWVLGRFLNLQDQGRYVAFWGAFNLWRDFPFLGAGLGAFDNLSYGFLPHTLSRSRLMYAHNDWVQLLAEMGLLGFLLVGGGWFLFLRHLLKTWRQRQDHWARGLGLGGLAALVAGAFHALGEFLFHIPAFSLTYAAVAALTFLTVHHHQPGERFGYATWRLTGNRLAPYVCIGLMLIQAVYASQAWYAWQAERAAPLELNSTRLPRTIQVADYSRAIALNPRNAGYYAGLARALEQKQALDFQGAQEIEGLLRQGIFRAPANWSGHYQLGDFLLRHYRLAPKKYLPRGLRELAAAVALFPEKAELRLRLGLALGWTEGHHYGHVPPELLRQAQSNLDKAAALEPKYKKFSTPKPPGS